MGGRGGGFLALVAQAMGTGNGAIAAQTATPPQAWNLGIASHSTDTVGFGLTFTATPSDGTALPAWLSFNSSGHFTGNPTTAGSWTIDVTATDINGQSATATFTVTVPVGGFSRDTCKSRT